MMAVCTRWCPVVSPRSLNSKSREAYPSCGFDPHLRHQSRNELRGSRGGAAPFSTWTGWPPSAKSSCQITTLSMQWNSGLTTVIQVMMPMSWSAFTKTPSTDRPSARAQLKLSPSHRGPKADPYGSHLCQQSHSGLPDDMYVKSVPSRILGGRWCTGTEEDIPTPGGGRSSSDRRCRTMISGFVRASSTPPL